MAGSHSRCGALCWHMRRNGFDLSRLLQPVEGELGDDVGDVTLVLHALAVADHRRVVVDALPRQDVPVSRSRSGR